MVEGADGISAYLDMLDTWYAEQRLSQVDVANDIDARFGVDNVPHADFDAVDIVGNLYV